MDDTERSDGYLAPVTYLFGAGADELPVERSVARPSVEPGWATPGVEFAEKPEALATPEALELTEPVEVREVGTSKESARDTTRAHNVGLHALTRRGQSVAEMTRLLENRELEPDVVAAEIKRLKSVGLLDDFALAETLVRTLSERKKLGKSSIASELRQRKIEPVAIDAALEALDGDDELARAIEVAVKRAGQLRSYDQETAKRRLSAFLQRRGYSGSVLSGAMSAALHPSANGNRGGGPRFE